MVHRSVCTVEVRRPIPQLTIFTGTLPQIALFYAVRYVLSNLDPQQTDRRKASEKGNQQVLSAAELGHVDLASLTSTIRANDCSRDHPTFVNQHESIPSIGGLDDVSCANLRESVIYPLMYPELFKTRAGCWEHRKGVLLYGHPGCGKTMLAKGVGKGEWGDVYQLTAIDVCGSGGVEKSAATSGVM